MHTHTPKSSAADKRASLSKYLEARVCVCVCVCGWVLLYWWEQGMGENVLGGDEKHLSVD